MLKKKNVMKLDVLSFGLRNINKYSSFIIV
jgi:hypothetical protein